MAVKTRAELLAANAALFVSNITGDITPPLEKAYNDHEIDSFVNRFGDTFEPDAIFEFDNGSKLREGVIQHGYGGGIARVCANDKTDQWEDGVRYLISTTGSTNTVVYAETINDIIPDDTYDVTLGYAVGSRFKNLVTGVEYLCNNADEDGAIWQAQNGSGTYTPTLSDNDFVVEDVFYVRTGDYVTVSGVLSYSGSATGTITTTITLPETPPAFSGDNKAWGQVSTRTGSSVFNTGFINSNDTGNAAIITVADIADSDSVSFLISYKVVA